ncbi:T3SS effector protein-tyrosine-phosphatase YopH [Yersinia enterocolitica]|uniref:T3SS effector protein-tyrosine-phosphatase YopH n=1 Tax=Yersinia enterocolitica TaxID=630 RepID=UPI003D7B4A8C
MNLSLSDLHRQVSRLVQQESGDCTGKLRGNVAANKETTFQGLTIASGARESEKVFAQTVLSHVANVVLTQEDTAKLLQGTVKHNLNNYELRSVGNGNCVLVSLRSDQMTLQDAKVLLEAALRQESGARGHVSSHSHSALHAPRTPMREELRSHLDPRTPPLPPRERPHTSGHHGAGEARATAPSTVSPYGPEARAELSSRLTTLRNTLAPATNDPRYLQACGGEKLNRFRDIQCCRQTAVRADLNANYIQLGNTRTIACQYPLQSQLESHFRMLAENRTPVLAVLASSSEIANQRFGMPDYFRQSGTYGSITVESKMTQQVGLGDGIMADMYTLTIREAGQKTISVPVVHVGNWPDQTAVSSEVTKALASLVDQTAETKRNMYESKGSSAVGDDSKLRPVIHCRAGVGRTAQLIGAMCMNDSRNSQLSVEDMVSQMRIQRNGIMVQKDEQLDVLIKLAEGQGRPLLNT